MAPRGRGDGVLAMMSDKIKELEEKIKSLDKKIKSLDNKTEHLLKTQNGIQKRLQDHGHNFRSGPLC